MWLAVWCIVAVVVALVALTRYCIVFPRQPATGHLPDLNDADRTLAISLETHVRGVASVPHNLDYPDALEASARYIEATLTGLGLVPVAQVYLVGLQSVRNIEVIFEPIRATGQTYIIGAHYDAPDDSPGANDNGSGVAALLELARSLRGAALTHKVRLVFFVNEEQPYGKTPAMGSFRHAAMLKAAGEPIAGMFALETLGFFTQRPHSQKFPFPLGLILPHTGNFIAFVGMPRARALVHHAVATFRQTSPFPAIGGIAPAFLEGIDLSDHWAYDQFGVPACMITDTAPFRNPFYHSPNDTPDTVDYASLAHITQGLDRMIRTLAGA
jgi:Peptidase family M28